MYGRFSSQTKFLLRKKIGPVAYQYKLKALA